MKAKKWLIAPIILLAAAAFFKFALIGYGVMALIFAGLALLTVIWHFAAKWLRVTLGVLVVLGLALFTVIEIPIIRAAKTDAPENCDYIIVLGAGVNGSTPSLSLVNRLTAALAYLEANPDTIAIVSGGQGPGEDMTEAEAMRIWLTQRGVDSSRIIEEPRATSTQENLAFSFEIIRERGDEPDSCAVVSSEYHLWRAKYLAELQGVTLTGVAGKTSYPVLMINYFIREGCGRIYYFVFGVR